MMDEATFREVRKNSIGGTDIASILGHNPFKSAWKVWAEKTGVIEPDDLDDNEAVEIGKALEAPIAAIYSKRTGHQIRKWPNTMEYHKDYPFLHVTPDRQILGTPGGLEVKTTGIANFTSRSYQGAWGEAGTDEVPDFVHLQCDWAMAITGREWWDVAAMIAGRGVEIFHIERNDTLCQLIIQKGVAFYEEFIGPKVEPPFDYAQVDNQFMQFRHPHNNGCFLDGDCEALELARNYLITNEQISDMETHKTELANLLKEKIGEYDGLLLEGISCTWKKNKDSVKTDWEAIVRELKPPQELIDKYTRIKEGARTLRVSEKKEKVQ